MTIDEQVECEQAVLASPEFKAALKKHYGIDDTRLVMVDIWSAGNYGDARRTARAGWPGRCCFLRSDPTDNGYARPIEGLAAGRRSQHDEGDPRRGVRPLAAAAGRVQLRRRPRAEPADRHQAARDHAAGGAELRGRRLPGALAELELRHRLQRPRRADAAPPALRRRRPGALDPVPRVAHRDGRPLRRSRPDAAPQERLRRRRVRHGHVRQQPGARLRLPRA